MFMKKLYRYKVEYYPFSTSTVTAYEWVTARTEDEALEEFKKIAPGREPKSIEKE